MRAAFVPHPPLLVPDLVGAGTPRTRRLLAACGRAVEFLLDPPPTRVIVLGGGTRDRVHPAGSWGTLGGFGVDVRAPAAYAPAVPDGRPPTLPLSLTLGSWLLDRASWQGDRVLYEVARPGGPPRSHEPPAPCGDREALLVLGDGSARRGEKAPRGHDPRAGSFDAAVARALRAGDPRSLLALDVDLADDLAVTGVPAWQALARAVLDTRPSGSTEPTINATLLYDDAPYGVGYQVATWDCHTPT